MHKDKAVKAQRLKAAVEQYNQLSQICLNHLIVRPIIHLSVYSIPLLPSPLAPLADILLRDRCQQSGAS